MVRLAPKFSGSQEKIVPPSAHNRLRALVEGVVQGVGFRPYVFRLARELNLTGHVQNGPRGVTIEIEGKDSNLKEFKRRIIESAPPLALIKNITWTDLPTEGEIKGEDKFIILASEQEGMAKTEISPDIATCSECEKEILSKEERRFGYEFTNCTNCGPRYTIIRALPYDRPNTTMASFPLCSECGAEYANPHNRRFHAQPVACSTCGPKTWLEDSAGNPLPDNNESIITRVAQFLEQGKIIAMLGLGGFHLACDATNNEAVKLLRKRKHRDEKPFAVMFHNLDAAMQHVQLSPKGIELLSSPQKPILLARKNSLYSSCPPTQSGEFPLLASEVAPHLAMFGCLLPYTPLHSLILNKIKKPLVMTSGNLSEEPIATTPDDGRKHLGEMADYFLMHNRPIHIRTDDSVVRVVSGRPNIMRRSRGYVPRAIQIPHHTEAKILALGAELKNTVALAQHNKVTLSHHIGSLTSAAAYNSHTQAITHLSEIFDFTPSLVIADMHPSYLNSRHATEYGEVIKVQHHHAHIASCMAENMHEGEVIGFAFDGAGYGGDGTIWGGEVLTCTYKNYNRVGHLSSVKMPGGDGASREGVRMAVAYAEQFKDAQKISTHKILQQFASFDEINLWASMVHKNINAPTTTSAGRLFDAAAALAGLRGISTYEGQSACEFEGVLDASCTDSYPCGIDAQSNMHVINGHEMLSAIINDNLRGVDLGIISARFHNGLADAITEMAKVISEKTKIMTVVLSGGVFQNAYLLERALEGLSALGLNVLTHRLTSAGDGGVALGQAAIGAAMNESKGETCA